MPIRSRARRCSKTTPARSGVKVDLKIDPLRAGLWVALEGTTRATVARYPDLPSGRQFLTSFEAPRNIGDYYVSRVRGYVYPPRTGEYTFWIASDNGSELWLSPDASADHAKRIASVPGDGYYTAPREWDKHPSQRSARIALAAGQRYYIEALHSQDLGEDCLAAAWEGPGLERAVIQGNYLSPWEGGQTAEPELSTPPPPTGTVLREYWLDCQNSTLANPNSYFPWRTETLPAEVGQPLLMVSRWRIQDKRSLPEPRRLPLQERLGTGEDFQWIETDGTIVSTSEDGAYWSILELTDQNHRLWLRVANPAQEKTLGLRNARVRVRGFCERGLNHRGERVPETLWIPGLQQVLALAPREEDWARLPVIPVHELTSSHSLVWAGQRVRVKGRAQTQHLGKDLIMQSGVSRFGALVSPDGTNWSQVGEPVEIPMNHAIYAGLAVASRSPATLATATLDHVGGFSGIWTNLDIGNPPLAGTGKFAGGTWTLKGSGGRDRDTGEAADQFHFCYQPLVGEGEVVARVVSVEEANPFAHAGLMLRETLHADSTSVILAISAARSRGAVLRVRRDTGNPNESVFSGQATPYWVKLVRRSAEGLLVHSTQNVRALPDQFVEAIGVLERTNQSWVLGQACYRLADEETNSPMASAGSPASSKITSARQIRLLSLDEALKFRPAEIRGVITAKAGDLYVQDATAGIRLPSLNSQLFDHCEVGQYVEVAGRCVPGDYSPVLDPTRVTVLGAGRRPDAQPKSWGNGSAAKKMPSGWKSRAWCDRSRDETCNARFPVVWFPGSWVSIIPRPMPAGWWTRPCGSRGSAKSWPTKSANWPASSC